MSIDAEDEELLGIGVGWYVRPYVLRSLLDAPTRLLPTIKPSGTPTNDGGTTPASGCREDRGGSTHPVAPPIRPNEEKQEISEMGANRDEPPHPCTGCGGAGQVQEMDRDARGNPVMKTVRCRVCGGSGRAN